jgi:hypothetical protein
VSCFLSRFDHSIARKDFHPRDERIQVNEL